jgi:hypothetical protein
MEGNGARARHFACLDVLLVAIGFWLVAPVPVALIGGRYDAGLFVRLANSILAGQWLGPFDALTLAKGPFYPLFLAGCAASCVPVQAGIEAVYLAGAVLMARVLARLSGRAWAGTFCLALLVFNPACTDWSAGALMREPLYAALTLLVMALAARLFLCGGGMAWGVALGAASAAFWLTREEGVLLVPSVLVLAAWYFWPYIVVGIMRLRHSLVIANAGRLPPILPLVTALATGLALVLGVCAINQHAYGVFRSNDFQAAPFARAYGALARIVPDRWQRLTPISRDMRQRAYSVSEAARELQPFLEGDGAPFTVDVLCSETPRPACHDIPGASFMWALRDAVTRAGYYDNARRADGFYKRLAREIDAACDRSALRCLPPRRGFMPPLDRRDALPILASLGHVVWDMLLLGRAGPLVMPSTAEGADALAYAKLTRGSAISPPARFIAAPAWEITGALSSVDPAAGLSITGPAATSIASDWRITPDPAANARLQRAGGTPKMFAADVRCAPGDCRLELRGAGGALGAWAMTQLKPGMILNEKQVALYMDVVKPLPTFSRHGDGGVRWAVMYAVSWGLEAASLMAIPAALVWLAICAVRQRPRGPLLVLALALLLAVILRMALLALLDATSIERQFRYESPAVALVLAHLAVVLQIRGGMKRH